MVASGHCNPLGGQRSDRPWRVLAPENCRTDLLWAVRVFFPLRHKTSIELECPKEHLGHFSVDTRTGNIADRVGPASLGPGLILSSLSYRHNQGGLFVGLAKKTGSLR